MPKLPHIRLFVGDWKKDPVAKCSLAAQGLWLRMMFEMHDSDHYGYLVQNGAAIPPGIVARRCDTTLDEYTTLLAELDQHGIPRRTTSGVLFSKRMVEDHKKRQKASKDGELGGNPRLIMGVNPETTLIFDSDNDSSEQGLGVQGERVKCPKSLDTPAFREAWRSWGEHRESIGKPLTLPMIRQQVKRFERQGVELAVATIEHTIANGWWGLHEPNLIRPAQQNGHPSSRVQKRATLSEALNRRIQP